MTDRLRVLVTGGTGRLARNWAAAMGKSHDVTLASRTRFGAPFDAASAILTFGDTKTLAEQLHLLRPDFVVHAAGMTDVDLCEADPAAAHSANVVAAEKIAGACAVLGTKLVHISTDHLFDSAGPLFDEAAIPSPVNVYGRTKAEAEARVLARDPDALVVRTNFFGLDTPNRPSLSGWILESIGSGRPVHLFDDVHFSPVIATSIAQDVHDLVEVGASGVVNLPAADRISKFTFGTLLADSFGHEPSLVIPSSINDRPDLATRPKEMALASGLRDKLLGRKSLPVEEHVEQLKGLILRGLGSATEGPSTSHDPY